MKNIKKNGGVIIVNTPDSKNGMSRRIIITKYNNKMRAIQKALKSILTLNPRLQMLFW